MPGYTTYWPQDRIKTLQKAGDTGPITVAFGSIHTRMPSIASVKPGDILYPVTVMDGTLCVIARLPVEKREPAYDYLVREIGNRCGALTPEGVDRKEFYDTPLRPHKEHQIPFNCCSKHAVSGSRGSSIAPRPLPAEILPELRFGYPKSKEKGLRFLKNGSIYVSCIACTRRLSQETFEIFEALFQDKAELDKGE